MIDPDTGEFLSKVADSSRGEISNRTHTDPLRALAQKYRAAAGTAFAAGNDAEAGKFREAAARLESIGGNLPPLTTATR